MLQLPLLSLTLLAALSPASLDSRYSKLADEIERRIVLPRGAHPLSAYARYYSRSGDIVVAAYVLPEQPSNAMQGCEVMTANSSRPCTEREIHVMKLADIRRLSARAPAGARRWYANERDMPGILDGGCGQVNVRYRISTHRILFATCNGFG